MSLQLIAGNSGSGKSHYIYEKIIRESVEHPERNYLMIVPEQFTMQTEKELVSLHPRKGILNIDVLSFNRLAYRVFEEVGGEHPSGSGGDGKEPGAAEGGLGPAEGTEGTGRDVEKIRVYSPDEIAGF